jgi:hypothetical protein
MAKKQKSSTTRKQAISARQKEGMALELRLAGKTLADIAAAVGYRDHTGAKRAIERAMERLGKPVQAEELRELEMQRLDKFLAIVSQALYSGKPLADQLAAIDRGLKIMERRARLCGLDAAEKHQIVTSDEERVAGMTPTEWARKKLLEITGEATDASSS